jgi:spermidine synthase
MKRWLLAALMAATAMSATSATQAGGFFKSPNVTSNTGVLHEERSLYRNLFVRQDGDERCLLFRARRNVGRESCKLMSNPDHLIFDYTHMMLAALYVDPAPKKILIIGLGGATIPDALQKMLPGVQLDIVEIDPAVDRVARKYFDFKPGPKTRVFLEDGRVFVKRAGRQKPNYDLVMLDAFAEDYIPEHMLTREFLQEVKAIMAPNGVLAANTWSTSELYDYESTTYADVFGPFYNLKSGNRIILTRLGGLPSPEELRANAAKWEPALLRRGVARGELMGMINTRVDWDTKARVLTDQYSPSNVLNARKRLRG